MPAKHDSGAEASHPTNPIFPNLEQQIRGGETNQEMADPRNQAVFDLKDRLSFASIDWMNKLHWSYHLFTSCLKHPYPDQTPGDLQGNQG